MTLDNMSVIESKTHLYMKHFLSDFCW